MRENVEWKYGGAFLLQLGPETDLGIGRFAGRVEHVATYEAAVFRTNVYFSCQCGSRDRVHEAGLTTGEDMERQLAEKRRIPEDETVLALMTRMTQFWARKPAAWSSEGLSEVA